MATDVTRWVAYDCIDESAKIELTAKRIVFGKFLNLGQTCVAPDYILCHEAVKDRLIENIPIGSISLIHLLLQYENEKIRKRLKNNRIYKKIKQQ